jgi:aryl-alcohol dehydrogenase-like predicted oxidoreductase
VGATIRRRSPRSTRALDLGVDFLDTAAMYGVGRNEELVGRAIGNRRGSVFLATKFGNIRAADGTFLGVNGRPDYIRKACEVSLKLQGTDSGYEAARIPRREPRHPERVTEHGRSPADQ